MLEKCGVVLGAALAVALAAGEVHAGPSDVAKAAPPSLPTDAADPLPKRPPQTLPYYRWAPVPYGYELRMGTTQRGLILGGTLTFAAFYAVSIATGIVVANDCRDKGCDIHGAELAIPVAGPFVAFSAQGRDEPTAAYVALGAMQAVGFGLLMASFSLDDKRLVRKKGAFAHAAQPASFSVTPRVAKDELGLDLRMAF